MLTTPRLDGVGRSGVWLTPEDTQPKHWGLAINREFFLGPVTPLERSRLRGGRYA